MKAEHFRINALFARAHNLPTSFNAIRARETPKAVWVYGHGVLDPEGHCACCGRTLTHPGSILIGIGPECLNNWGARDQKLDNMTEADKKYLKSLITNRLVDTWIPKTCLKKYTPTEEDIELPLGHKSFKPNEAPDLTQTARLAADVTPNMQVIKKEVETKRAREWKGVIAIQFPYSYETLTQVKSLDGRRWHPEGKYWTCPLTVQSIRKLESWGFELDFVLKEHIRGMNAHFEFIGEEKLKKKIDITHLGLKRELFPYQKEGVAFIESRNGRALIGDDMGLGKTIQALAYLQLHPELRPAVVLCPASLKLNWAKEVQMTMTRGTKTQILSGQKPYKVHGEIVIINYDILKYWQEAFTKVKVKIIIADEIHYIKSTKAKRTKAVKLFAKSVPHFIALSGTPIVNRPIEIYNPVSIINPDVLPRFLTFAKRYCGGTYNGFGWEFKGATHTEELHKLLTDTVMIRRKKSDVLKDLPDKIRSFVPIELDNAEEYGAAEKDVIGYILQQKGQEAADKASNAEVIVRIEQLKQVAARGKMNSVVEWIQDFLETDEKLVVFATHKFVIERLVSEFPGIAVKIDGSTSLPDRDKAVVGFQENPAVRLMIGNIKAAGIGLTLTAASNVAVVELPWTPGDLKQAEDRCHRIGQKDTVNIHLLLAEGTIDGEIASLLDTKIKVLDAVLDGVETTEESLLTELMRTLTSKTKELTKQEVIEKWSYHGF